MGSNDSIGPLAVSEPGLAMPGLPPGGLAGADMVPVCSERRRDAPNGKRERARAMKSYLLDEQERMISSERPVLDTKWGTYEGDCVIRLLPGGRLITIAEPFAFITPDGIRIEATVGRQMDGTSWPWLLRRLPLGLSPFTGRSRWAFVPHDELCARAREGPVPYTSEWAHHVHYQAARAGGASRQWAALMERGLLIGGPKRGNGYAFAPSA